MGYHLHLDLLEVLEQETNVELVGGHVLVSEHTSLKNVVALELTEDRLVLPLQLTHELG